MKALSLLTLATLITAFSGMAHAENLFVNNAYRGMNGVQITVTKKDGALKDSVCLQPNTMAYLNDYDPKLNYLIKAEIKEGYGCEGKSINSFENEFNLSHGDMQADVDNYGINMHPHY